MKFEPTPVVEIGDRVRIVRLHPTSTMSDKQEYEGKTGTVDAHYHGPGGAPYIGVKGCPFIVAEWEQSS